MLFSLTGTVYVRSIYLESVRSPTEASLLESEVDFPSVHLTDRADLALSHVHIDFGNDSLENGEHWQPKHESEMQGHDSIEELKELFESQSIDPEWSTSASDVIYKILDTDEFIDTLVLDVDCRSTVCRLAVWHSGPMKRDDFQDLFPVRVLGTFEQFSMDYIDQSNVQTISLMYLKSSTP